MGAHIVCVQNHQNLAHRADDGLIDEVGKSGIPYVPYFPLGGFTQLQSAELAAIARRLEATSMQVALAWSLRRAPNLLLIPGNSSLNHLRRGLAATRLVLSDAASAVLGRFATETGARGSGQSSVAAAVSIGRMGVLAGAA